MAKVKNYNLNVTEVRDSDFKNAFPGIFNFTVGILSMSQYIYLAVQPCSLDSAKEKLGTVGVWSGVGH